MTTATTQALPIYSRCLRVVDEATGRRCGHPATLAVAGADVVLAAVEEMRHSIICEDDLGHTWAVVWSTDLEWVADN